jgi:glycosyltransferase involved in cell wall biosynthesis
VIDVGISFGKLATLTDGLGEFAVQLGRRFAARAPGLEARHGVRLSFHLPPRRVGFFGDGVAYLPATSVQKWLHRSPRRFALWHSLHQLNRFRPPTGAGLRLVTGHDLNFFYVKEGLSLWRHLRWARGVLARTDHLVTITDHVRRDYQDRMGWRGPVTVIHNGVRSLVGDPEAPVDGLEGRPFFFHLSRLAPSKNPDALLGLAGVWPEKTFVLGGPPSGDSARLVAQAAALGLRNVRVLTAVTEPHKAWLYRHCEAFLFPSLTEGFGLPPIEAMHFGKPVFLSDRTSLPEVGGDQAFYWHDFEPAAMRRVMEAGLARFAAERLEGAVVARAHHFDWERCADAYVALYLDLLRGRGLLPRLAAP